ncbi:Lrp/AsnC family transcriptional regulator [Pyrococcus yayanosii]|uniref:AsnC family transcriptional regulator n=1 Tax=Pyrococcus yayanosii (strain CH1 / JCM 16557) TaxID=529709 RepID=F8AEB2_PYRYC|nr:Lrp/AsnC family transcriptional regulator [Pyrococcus yayanosii]AEH24623.1 AsnC family transcriptional regulator [Pyrococcus yayanosii CH1]
MAQVIQLDDLDRAILKLLKEDARLTIAEISSRLNKPESTVHFRIKKLQEKGVIEKYTIILGDPLKPKHLALVVLEVERPIIEDFLERYVEYITKTLSMLPNVLLVAKSGDDKIVALVGDESKEKLTEFIEDNIKTIPTLRNAIVLPLSEFKKGNDIAGFLAEV